MPILYIVGTPIGNLGDMSPRGIEVLSSVDFIAAEDTRVTLKLLSRFDIKKPMISYYEHNIRQRGQEILDRIQSGQSCAIVTDAGMPCISDPGEDLVGLCAAAGVEIVVVPGPSAAISALALSGLPSGRFCFEGFLTMSKSGRIKHLEELKNEVRTMIFYEAPHKLLATLQDMLAILGDRRISICRELTKLHEETLRMSLEEAVAHFTENRPRGEFVLVIEGTEVKEESFTLEAAAEIAKALTDEGMPASAAARQAAARTGHKKGDIYKTLIQQGDQL